MRFFLLKIIKLIMLLVIIVLLIIKCDALKVAKGKLSDTLWSAIEWQLDREEEARLKAKENNEIVRGKDTAFIWNKHYDIWRHMGEYHFSVELEDISGNILKKVTDYKTYKDKFYVIAEEGYAVVDRENYCKVFVTVPDDEFVNGYYEDKEGNRTYISRKAESKYIEYLSSYEEFSEKDRKVFEKMKSDD